MDRKSPSFGDQLQICALFVDSSFPELLAQEVIHLLVPVVWYFITGGDVNMKSEISHSFLLGLEETKSWVPGELLCSI